MFPVLRPCRLASAHPSTLPLAILITSSRTHWDMVTPSYGPLSIDVGLVKDVDYSCASPIFTHYSSESELIIGPFRGSAMYIDRRHDRCMLHSVWQRVELALKWKAVMLLILTGWQCPTYQHYHVFRILSFQEMHFAGLAEVLGKIWVILQGHHHRVRKSESPTTVFLHLNCFSRHILGEGCIRLEQPANSLFDGFYSVE